MSGAGDAGLATEEALFFEELAHLRSKVGEQKKELAALERETAEARAALGSVTDELLEVSCARLCRQAAEARRARDRRRAQQRIEGVLKPGIQRSALRCDAAVRDARRYHVRLTPLLTNAHVDDCFYGSLLRQHCTLSLNEVLRAEVLSSPGLTPLELAVYQVLRADLLLHRDASPPMPSLH